ncbi:hypothetical protein [Halobacterium salinarum]|uniref:hypothetical protein n=1 Tax=Halobacterium salinarum TaxID=2242 RepID=UPI0025536CEC|nr:hypothetical protein [Halobacterium salinarum]MDL0126633.1 hypothetical protein [Halobacterium salinarum]
MRTRLDVVRSFAKYKQRIDYFKFPIKPTNSIGAPNQSTSTNRENTGWTIDGSAPIISMIGGIIVMPRITNNAVPVSKTRSAKPEFWFEVDFADLAISSP